jgi:methyl-accepting chemotaxis protein
MPSRISHVKIKTQLISAFAFLTLLFLVATGVTWTATDGMQDAAHAVDESVTGLTQDQLKLIRLVKDIELNVVQVQQWLTDISATRGLDGLDDGYAQATEQAQRFEANVAAARTLAEAHGYDELVALLDRTKANFVPYYAIGKEMAAAYIESGPSGGNIMMGRFDEDAQRIQDSLGALLEEAAAITTNSTSGLSRDIHGIAVDARELSLIVMIVGFFGIAGVLVIGALAYFRIVAALARFAGAVEQIAAGPSIRKFRSRSAVTKLARWRDLSRCLAILWSKTRACRMNAAGWKRSAPKPSGWSVSWRGRPKNRPKFAQQKNARRWSGAR